VNLDQLERVDWQEAGRCSLSLGSDIGPVTLGRIAARRLRKCLDIRTAVRVQVAWADLMRAKLRVRQTMAANGMLAEGLPCDPHPSQAILVGVGEFWSVSRNPGSISGISGWKCSSVSTIPGRKSRLFLTKPPMISSRYT
jgi:hypothetical protein